MASLRTSLSSTKICQNSLNTCSLVYLALLLDSGCGQVLTVKHRTGLSSWNRYTSLCTDHGPWMQWPKHACIPIFGAAICGAVLGTNKQTRLRASDRGSVFFPLVHAIWHCHRNHKLGAARNKSGKISETLSLKKR